jgi:hypothetical protein
MFLYSSQFLRLNNNRFDSIISYCYHKGKGTIVYIIDEFHSIHCSLSCNNILRLSLDDLASKGFQWAF